MATATRDRILSAARDLFVEGGPDALTMRAVAARAGLTAMALYRHFAGRDALLRAVVDQGHETFLRYLQRALGEPSPRERLIRAGLEYLDFALEHPDDYAVMFLRPTARSDARPSSGSKRLDAATFRFLVDRIRECAAAGVLRADDPEVAALGVWAHVHGLVALYLADKLPLDEVAFREVFARSIEDLARALPLAAGIRRRPRRAARV